MSTITTAQVLANLVHPAVREPLLKLAALDPKLAKRGNTQAAELTASLGEAHLSRGHAHIARLLEAVGHVKKLLLVFHRALAARHLHFDDLGEVVPLVNRLLAYAEQQGCAWQARQHDIALTRAAARQANAA